MKIKLHPLFLIAGLVSAFLGALPVFIICALTALLHECGHIFCARRMGFECKEINLMPYGASALCDIEGISASDEVRLALAGPFVNFAICVGVAGLWWFVPDTYAFTDTIFYANAGMLVLNLLPAYPLDGGRVTSCLLRKFLKARIADLVLKIFCALISGGLVALYFTVLKNPYLLFVSAFLLCSVFEKRPPAQKINFASHKKKRGREIRYIILDESATFKDALRFLDESKYLVIQIYGETFLDEITEDEFCERLLTHSIYDRIL